MKRSAAIALALLLATPAVARQPATPIKPGYWESTSQVTSPFPAGGKTERKCIKAEDIDKFMGGAPNRHYTCTYPTKVISGGKIKLEGTCQTKNSDPVPVSGEGTYTPDSFDLDARISASVGGVTLPIRAKTSARRIADACPAPDSTPNEPGA
jgi:hypothetical protein